MSEIFDSIYADAYDKLYRDKDYVAECDLIERIFQVYGSGPTSNVLDLGCGTGNHTLLLAQRGYEVVGVDCSESMLTNAREKAVGLSSNVTFHRGDIRSVDLHRHFDVVLMMFAVLGYQLENTDVLSALRTAHRHLCSNGLLIFDVWYGPAVLHQRLSQRIKIIPSSDGQILRVASGKLDIQRHVCKVLFHLWKIKDKNVVSETEETHYMRFFFPKEIELFLEISGFSLIHLGNFPEIEKSPDESSWNVIFIAKKGTKMNKRKA